MVSKKVVITGIFGQDGSYIAELLKEKGYEVYGLIQKELSSNAIKIKDYLAQKNIVNKTYVTDLSDFDKLKNILIKIRPDEIYHLAASHVSSQSLVNNNYNEMLLFKNNVNATLNILSICNEYLRNAKIVTAGSCLVFDNSKTTFQNESTILSSNSLYGLAKIAELNLVKYYRAKGLNTSTAILYNHESSRRKDTFVTKKIVKNLIAIKQNKIDKFTLGNIDIEKDWGYAKDYAYAMYLMAQQDISNDYIISSGKAETIRTFIELTAKKLKIKDWKKCIITNDSIITRKTSTKLIGDCSQAVIQLDWNNKNTSLDQVIETMINNELNNTLE